MNLCTFFHRTCYTVLVAGLFFSGCCELCNMGLDPYPVLYCPWNNPVFPPGSSPLICFVSFSQIQVGQPWRIPPFPEPCNGCHVLIQRNQFQWDNWDQDPDVFISYSNDGSLEEVVADAGAGIFQFTYDAPSSQFGGANEYTGSTQLYYGGFCSVSFPNPGIPASVQEIMSLLGIPVEIGTKYENVPQNALQSTYRFARKKDHTCIRVLVDNNHLPP
jgi:hypothetical protein